MKNNNKYVVGFDVNVEENANFITATKIKNKLNPTKLVVEYNEQIRFKLLVERVLINTNDENEIEVIKNISNEFREQLLKEIDINPRYIGVITYDAKEKKYITNVVIDDSVMGFVDKEILQYGI